MDLATAKTKTDTLKTRSGYVRSGGPFNGFTDSADNAKLFDALEAISQHIRDLETRVTALER